jgi:putative acetyltransferase
LRIRIDDLRGPEIAAFLEEHLQDMRAASPPESKHALDLEGLRRPEITFWTVWDGPMLAACGAIKQLDAGHGEIKFMRTAAAFKQKGVASLLLAHILETARLRGYRRLSLEIGSMAFFEPARRLYAKSGFAYCGPFADYKEDPNSVLMSLAL